MNSLMLKPILLISVIAVFLVVPQNAFAQIAEDDVGTLPNSPLYGFKLFIENLQEGFTFNQERRAELILEHAEKRKAEVNILEARMIPIPDRVLENLDQKLERAQEIILRFEEENRVALEAQDRPLGRPQLTIDQSEDRVSDQEAIGSALGLDEEGTVNRLNFIETPQALPVDQLRMDGIQIRPVSLPPIEKIQDTDTESEIRDKLRNRLTQTFTDREIIEIKSSFQELVAEDDPVQRAILADEIDDQVNSPLVNIACFGTINSLSIADSPDPVREIQDQCLLLKPIPTEELRKIMSSP